MPDSKPEIPEKPANTESRFDTVNLLLEIRQRLSDGALWTSHRPATPGDASRLELWPSRGLIQVAQALMIEALRREAYTMAITMASQKQEITPASLLNALTLKNQRFIHDFGPGAVQDALSKI